jgi:hypothetical protein
MPLDMANVADVDWSESRSAYLKVRRRPLNQLRDLERNSEGYQKRLFHRLGGCVDDVWISISMIRSV